MGWQVCQGAFRISHGVRTASPSLPPARMGRSGFGRFPKLRTRQPQVLTAHKGPVLSVAWSADGSRLASGGNDGTVYIWRPSAAFGPVTTYSKGVPLNSLSVSEDGKRIAAGSERGDVFAWDAETGANSAIWNAGSRVLCLAWQPGQERLASGNESGEIHVWHRSARDPVNSVKPARVHGSERSDSLARALVA